MFIAAILLIAASYANAHFAKLGTGYFGCEEATILVRTELVPSLDVTTKMSMELGHAELMMKHKNVLDAFRDAALPSDNLTTCAHVLVKSRARLEGNIRRAKWIKRQLQPKRDRETRSIMDFFSMLFGIFN